MLRRLENLHTPYLVPIKPHPSDFQKNLKETKNAIEANESKIQIGEFKNLDPRTCGE